MIIQDEKVVKRVYKEQNRCLYQTWLGYTSSEEWKRLNLQLLDIFDIHDINKVLADSFSQCNVSKEDSIWTADVVMPELVTRGLSFVAMLVPKDEFAKMAIDKFKYLTEGNCTIKYFDDYKEAEKWLLSCED